LSVLELMLIRAGELVVDARQADGAAAANGQCKGGAVVDDGVVENDRVGSQGEKFAAVGRDGSRGCTSTVPLTVSVPPPDWLKPPVSRIRLKVVNQGSALRVCNGQGVNGFCWPQGFPGR